MTESVIFSISFLFLLPKVAKRRNKFNILCSKVYRNFNPQSQNSSLKKKKKNYLTLSRPILVFYFIINSLWFIDMTFP